MKFKDLKTVLKGSAILKIEDENYHRAYWEDNKVCETETWGKWEDDYIYDEYKVKQIKNDPVHEILVEIYW